MKRKCFICVRIVCFLILFIGIMYYLSNVLTTTKELTAEDYPTRNSFWQNINAEDNNTIDAMFIGDSTVMHAVNPIQIWKDEAITSYIMSYTVMKPEEAYFDLKKLFKTQSPKNVFLEATFLVTLNKGNFEYFTDKTKNIVDYSEDQISGTINTYLPVMKYKTAWKTTKFSDLIHFHPSKINSIFKGYKYASETVPFTGEHNKKVNAIAKYKDNGNVYFDKIYNLCKENNCTLSLVTFPQGSVWNQVLHDKVECLAEDYGVKYIDYDLDMDKLVPDFSWKTDTKDGGGHLNYRGATKITKAVENDMVTYFSMNSTSLNSAQTNKWNNDKNDFYKAIKYV